MKFYTTLLITCLLSVSNLSCAEQGENEHTVNGITESTLLLDSGDVFMKGKAADANYFSMSPAAPKELAKRFTWILQEMDASPTIINFAKNRLINNRRLKKDNFTLPLTDEDGTVYQFVYQSDVEAKLYFIYYSKL